MAANDVQLPIWTNANPFKLFNSNKKRHSEHAKTQSQFLKYQMEQYVRNTRPIFHTKRHLYKWINNSTRTQLWEPNTLRRYLRDIKLKIAEEQDNDDISMDENNSNNNDDNNNDENNEENNNNENIDDDANNDR